MRIFLDLDDTLIHSVYNHKNNKNRTYIQFKDDGRYGSVERPIAKDLIQFARSIDPDVSILTTATMDWAMAWSNVFQFGFDENHIYDRHAFTTWRTSIYGGTDIIWNEKSLNLKHAVIVDNNHLINLHDASPIHKMNFLFGEDFDDENWIHMRAFDGNVSADALKADERALDLTQKKILERVEKSLTN
jgi:hypothetical protein